MSLLLPGVTPQLNYVLRYQALRAAIGRLRLADVTVLVAQLLGAQDYILESAVITSFHETGVGPRLFDDHL